MPQAGFEPRKNRYRTADLECDPSVNTHLALSLSRLWVSSTIQTVANHAESGARVMSISSVGSSIVLRSLALRNPLVISTIRNPKDAARYSSPYPARVCSCVGIYLQARVSP